MVFVQLIFPLLTMFSGSRNFVAGDYEKELYKALLNDYNPLVRPIKEVGDPVDVTIGITLQQIIDIDEKNQVILTNVWLNFAWKDAYLVWDPSLYGNVSEVRIPINKIWKPDVLLYNSADTAFDSTYPANAVVYSSGDITWIPPGIITSSCKINIQWFPFDDQHCSLKFGSWTYSGGQINLLNGTVNLQTYTINGEWLLLEIPVERNLIYYDCCPDPYIDVTFTLVVRRRTLYYTLNLIIPCVLISSMTLLAFVLPPESGEKLSLVVTIFMSLCITMLMVAEAMPQTSEVVPLIALYFSAVMIVVALSIILTVLGLNYHHRNPETHHMGDKTRFILLKFLPSALCMTPFKTEVESEKTLPSPKIQPRTDSLMRIQQQNSNSKRSLLANVLDMEDHLMGGGKPLFGEKSPEYHGDQLRYKVYTAANGLKFARPELIPLIKELQFITDKMRKTEEAGDIIHEWRYAAMVIDRVSLIFSSAVFLFSTGLFMYAAPHLWA